MRERFGALLGDLLDLVAPRVCVACRERSPIGDPGPGARAVLCARCADGLEPAEDPPAGVQVAYAHREPLASAVLRAKYGGDPAVARRLGELLVPLARRFAGTVDRVVPVPLHPRRRAQRGYNQSAELARAVARELRVARVLGAVARTRDTPSQTRLGRRAREANVQGAFSVRDPAALRGRAVLVVDDVVTTGATLAAVRAALEGGGARVAGLLALARAPWRHSDGAGEPGVIDPAGG